MADEAKRYDAAVVQEHKDEVQQAVDIICQIEPYAVNGGFISHLHGTPYSDTLTKARKLLETAIEQLDELPIALE